MVDVIAMALRASIARGVLRVASSTRLAADRLKLNRPVDARGLHDVAARALGQLGLQ